MAQWRKVIVSGSNSELNNITSSGDFHLKSDGGKLRFGADAEVTLTHEHNAGLILSDDSGIGTTKLSLGDNATFLQQQADGELGIDADVKVDITAPAVSMSNDLYVGGDIKAIGDITFNAGSSGNITLGSADDDNVVFSADVNSNIIPNTDNSFDLGSSSQQWKDIYINGVGYIDSLGTDADPSNAYIGGGEIDGTVIGGESAAAGTFTTLSATTLGAALDVDNQNITNVDINSGAIDGTTIGGESAAAGTFTTLSATTLGGALDVDNQNITNVDIDSGAIDNTVIGGATPAAGTFTTLGATGISSLSGDVNLGDALADDVNLKGHLTGSVGAHLSMSLSSTGSFGKVEAAILSGRPSITFQGNVTASGHVSGSLTSTGSFGMLGAAVLQGRPGIILDGTTLSSTPSSTIDFDAGGAITIDGASVTIGGDGDTGAIAVDSTAGISLDAAAASNFTLSDGDLSLIADGSDNKVVIKGDHESDVAIHLDGNAGASSVVDIDAGVLDADATSVTIDATSAISLDAAAASNFTVAGANLVLNTTTSGDIDLTAAANLDLDGASVDIDSTGNTTITAATNMVVKGNSSAKYGDDTGTLDFSGDGAVTDTGVTTYNLSPSSTFDIDAAGATTIDSDAALTLGGDEIAISADGSAGNGALTINTTDTTNGINIGDSTSGVPITIGHGTSETAIGDNLTVGGNVAIAGDLDVNGTLTTIDTTNLQVKDAFVQLASGSTDQVNAGIIANTTADGKGSAFYYDGTNQYNRWALTGKDETSHTATGDIVPRQFVMTVSASAESPAIGSVPSDFGGTAGNSRVGMVYIQTGATAASSSVAGDIWIYS